MGGEPWKIISPWRPDIATVLHETRERVFRDGLYGRVAGRTFESLAALDAFFMDEPDLDAMDEWTDEGAEGTGSILDIRAVGAELEPGATAPLASRDLVTLFGTAQPGAADLTDDRESAIFARLTRGDSLYVVLYTSGKPSEVAFYGYSWD